MVIYTVFVVFIGYYLFSEPQSEFANHSLPLVFLIVTPHYFFVLLVGLFRIAGLYEVQQGCAEGNVQKLPYHCPILQHQQQLPFPLRSVQLLVYLLPSCYYEILKATFTDILLTYAVHFQQSEEVPIPISIVLVVLPQQSQQLFCTLDRPEFLRPFLLHHYLVQQLPPLHFCHLLCKNLDYFFPVVVDMPPEHHLEIFLE